MGGMRLVNAVAALAAFISTPAFAGWQWTHWGMTPQQVQASAPVKIGAYSDPGLDTPQDKVRLVTTHRAGVMTFSVALLFDAKTNGLSKVRLLLDGDQRSGCEFLYGSLSETYGSPEDATPGAAVWRDQRNGNLIEFNQNGACWLIYAPIPTTEDSGL